MSSDPAPGDPDRIERLGGELEEFADDVFTALGKVRSMGEEGALATFVGESAEAYRDRFDKLPPDLDKLHTSYDLAAQALLTYAPKLREAQTDADRALVEAIEAREELSTAQSWLERATSALEDAEEAAEPPDEGEVAAEVRRALTDAESDQGNAESAVTDARGKLDLAIALAGQAKELREEAAQRCKADLEEASEAGIPNRKWWQKAADWVVDNWDTIVAVAQVVVTVLSIVALVLGGPLVWGLILAASLIILADTLIDYANGEASLWDVGFALLDCVPGGRLASAGAKTATLGMARGARGQGRQVRQEGRPAAGKNTSDDPVDFATGEVLLPATDIDLPGVLPLLLERHHISTYRAGRLFGRSWSSTLDQRLVLEADSITFHAADCTKLLYPVPTRDPDDPVMPVEGPRWGLSWDGRPGSPLTIHQRESGRTLHFAPVPGAPGNELPLVAVTDRNENRIEIRHNEAGEPVEVTHSGGYRIGVAVVDRRVTSYRLLSAPEQPVLLAFDYDDAGNLARVFNSSGLPLRFWYDEQDRLIRWEDRNNTWYRYEYDQAGRCVFGTGSGRVFEYRYEYDTANHRTTAYAARGYPTVYQFNDSFQLVAETDPLGHTTHRTRDRYDHLLSVTDPLGHTTRYVRNEHGDPTTVIRPDDHEIHAEYNDLGLPTAITEADGTTWRQEFDERGNRTTVIDPAGHRTTWTHHPTGAPATVTDALGAITRIDTDPTGLPVAVVDPLGATTALDRDAFGRPTSITDPMGAITRMEWSPEGKPVRRTDPLGHVESWEWDAEGNCLTHTDENGGITAWSYGPFDLPVSHTGPDGARYVLTRDTELNITAVTAPDGRSWTYTLDPAGRVVAETDYDGRTTTREFDPVGRLVRQMNPAGQTIDYVHDVLGQPVSATTDTGETTTWTHDPAGRIVSATSPGVELSRTHDSVGNLLGETVNGHTLTLTVDPVGNLLSRTTPTGHTTTWTHDAAGRPIGLDSAGWHLNFRRDAAGREVERRIGGALTLTTGHDATGRLVEQALTGTGDRRLHHKRWTHRADGYPTAVTDATGTTTLTLDAIGRPTSLTGPAGTETYTYNPTGDQTAATAPGLPADAVGERAYTGTLLARAGRTRYAYDAAGRVIRRTVTRISRTPDTWHHTWDAHDRLVETRTPDGTVWTYTYDPFGRRIAKHRHHPDGSVAETVRFTWHDTTLIEEHHARHDGTRPATVTTWDHTGLHPLTQTTTSLPTGGDLAKADQGEIDRRFAAIVTDLVGTPTHLTDPDTGHTTPLATTLWGHTPGTAPTPLRFPGQYADEETGWHYNLHRHYDPTTARYTTPDPLGLAPAPNPHTYPHNPWTWTDPLGLAGYSADLDALSQSGTRPAKGNTTHAGREYQKHMNRGDLPVVPGKQLKTAGQDLLDDILTNPKTVISPVNSGNFAGGTRYIMPDPAGGRGTGATFDAIGRFQYFGRY
ncbi:DUF6531 domain-containing protein [Streptomyces sp. ST2-7A]|nr:DUF6531 domain-containing protein [Streptomyces sp. ST2-7A]